MDSFSNHPDHSTSFDKAHINRPNNMKTSLDLILSSFHLVVIATAAFQPQQSRPPVSSPRGALPSRSALSVARNVNFAKLAGGYLFPEIGRRRTAYAQQHPEMANRIISLGIGDTTLPIPPHILSGLQNGATKLGTKEGYTGYGDVQGRMDLREKIATTLYKGIIEAEEVFVTDGAKCDIMRLQQMFGPAVVTAVQDPSYPVYVDTSVMLGQTKGDSINPQTNQYDTIIYMPCTPENGFFPDYAQFPRADVVFICSPNNPTGAVATYDQLKQLVQTCKERNSILVFDAAYAPFIRSPNVPKSIFEIPGAMDVAIEVNSFSKYAGFTGVRLGWVVCPKALKFDDGTPVWNDLNRVMGTTFNGASNIVQEGGMACLDEAGLKEIDSLIDYYLENAKILKTTMEGLGFTVYGGVDAPYVFVALPDSMGGSWNAFQTILDQCQVVTIPGAGFGPGGEGYLRLSAFAPRPAVEEACLRLTATFSKIKVEMA